MGEFKRCYWCGFQVNNVLQYDNEFSHHPSCPIRQLLRMNDKRLAYKPRSLELEKLDKLGAMAESGIASAR